MTSLHSLGPSIHPEIARAAAILNRSYPRQIRRFRLTGTPYNPVQGDWSAPVEYFYEIRNTWETWSNHSLRTYLAERSPTQEEVAAVYAMFEPKP